MKSKRVGTRQSCAIEVIKDSGGVANTYTIQKHCGVRFTNAALDRLVKRGVLKKAYMSMGEWRIEKNARLTQKQVKNLDRAIQKNPRASTFWIAGI